MMAELYALPHAKDAYELAMRASEDRDHATAVKVTTAMVSVSPAGGVLRAAKAAKKQARLAGRAERSPGDTLRTAVEQRASRLQLMPAGPAGRAGVRLSTSWGCRRCRAVSDVGAAFSCPNSLRLSTFTEGCDAREQARGPESRWPASNLRRDRCGAAGRGPRCAPRSVMKLFAGHLDFGICSAPTRSRGCISENISRLACWRLYWAFDGLGDALVVSSTRLPGGLT